MKNPIFIFLGVVALCLAMITFYAACIAGVIYFLFWCLKHFGVIA